jgi:ADP-ribose pyrophosphatase YjhB (NUDIX family)
LLGVGALILKRDSILLVERGKQPLKGFWSLPGGLVETGELLAGAIEREVLEETGLVVKAGAVVEIFERIMRDKAGTPEYHYVLIDYLCKVTGGELRPGSDSSAVEWVRRKDLAARKLTEGTLELIERTFDRRGPGSRTKT